MLSTVGYGDFFPISSNEMIVASVIMVMGVAVFSWVMSEISFFMQMNQVKDNSAKQFDLNIWH